MQYLGWFESQNTLFTVTGSCINPNVTAMFLALTVPIFLFLFRSKYRKIYQIGFIILLIALLLLQCRAALIGATLAIVVFYSLEYHFVSWLKNKKNGATAKALFVLSLLIIIPMSIHLYNTKKASADGRKFIWKLSTEMVTQKPIIGYGYGYFSKEYNLFQADYIQKGKASSEEMENAGPVFMAHNELLQNAVEGGVVGLTLILLFFGSLLLALKQRKKDIENKTNNINNVDATSQKKNSYFNLSYAGVIGFMAMSMVNFTIQNIPVMSLLTLYAAIICSMLEPIQLPHYLVFIKTNNAIKFLSKTLIITISLFLAYTLFGIAKADSQNKKASLLKKERHYEQALLIMPSLEPYLKDDSDYWKNYGNLYYQTHNYPVAIACLKKGKETDASPELYLGLGVCYEKLNQYPTAIAQYTQLIALHPSKFEYRYRLMNAYVQNKNIEKAIAVANEIITLKPKIPSKKVNQYKYAANALLRNLNVPKKQNPFEL
ncbi:O-antigen ligase family protein [Flavobacterium sp.]|uniref:O-antigen ligase family protein n=1 Tax=Flavobacterium sp. TaxID=239 RepID=UPI0038FCCE95